MHSSRWTWRIAGITALLSTCLLVAGLAYAVSDIVNPRGTPFADAPDSAPNAISGTDGQIGIVALGDSLTKGTGDRTGAGYVGRLRDKLASVTGMPVNVLNNLAVNGYRTDQLLGDISDKPSVQRIIRQADVIVFTIGGNDLFRYVRDELDITSPNVTAEDLFASIPEPASRFGEIMSRLADLNPDAVIVYVGLYNPFLDLDPSRQSSLAIAEWNRQAYEHVNRHPNAIMVPTFDLFERHLLDYLYSDHFHPNDAGYERIADRVVQALE